MARQRYGPRRWPLFLAGAVVILAFLFSGLSRFVIDLLWFREVHLSSEFWTILRTKIVLGLLAGVLFFAVLYLNLLFVKWLTPETRILTPDMEAVERFRSTVERSLWWALPAASAVIAFFVGLSATHEWQTFLLWKNSGGLAFHNPEPLFHRDPAFYVFSLPWLKFVQGWLFSTLVGVLLLVAIGHFLWGGIRPQAPSIADKVAPQVRAHLSVLLGLIMIAKAWGYWLGRFDLLTSPRGVVEGASYTDVHAQLPALTLLAVVALICAILFLVNIRVRLWSLPVIAVALLGVVSILLGALFPAVVQAVSVKPQEFQAESPYIKDNIDGTRLAFGLNAISVSSESFTPSVTTADLKTNQATVHNIRLWRPGVLLSNFEASQQNRQYYTFQDVDVDRYKTQSGTEQMLMVSARQIDQNALTGTGATWQNQHLVYTHGYGAVAAEVNTANSQGAPSLTLQDIPPIGTPSVDTQPRVYFGENQTRIPFVVVDTKSQELDYEGAPGNYSYDASGGGGIPMGNIFERALFAWRYRDVNLLISRLITPTSRIMINRDILDRAKLAAPFLQFDGDPYLAIIDGQMDWIVDAYTTTNAYPYSQSLDLQSATGSPGLAGQANYIRNSVKVVINAYSGQMTFYDVSGGADPIIRAWERAFPGMFTTSPAPESVQAHFRYPENLFQVQSQQFATYHVTDAQTFYKRQDAWQIPIDPATWQNLKTQNASLPVPGPTPAAPTLRPTYMLMQLPGDKIPEFVLMTPFVPAGRSNPMVGWMAASSDPGVYGKIRSFTLPPSLNVDAPPIAFGRITQDPQFSAQQTLLSQSGSRVFFGDLLTVPMGNSFIYVQPVYVQAAGQTSTVPELKFVTVVDGGSVGLGTTLDQALSQVTGAAVPGQNGGQGGQGKGGTVQQQIQRLLGQALDHFNAANQALQSGDLGKYQTELKIAQSLVQKANSLAAQLPSGGTTTPPSPTGSPSIAPSPAPSGSASPSPTP